LPKGEHHDPVIGLDISKGRSEGQSFLSKGQPYGRSFPFLHTLEGFQDLLSIIHEIRSKAGSSPAVILESTRHYHQAVIQFLESHEILFVVVNPLISDQAKKSSLRKVKTLWMPTSFANFITMRSLKPINKEVFNCLTFVT
jgi:transposase